jgi:hypothetical protein
MILPRFVTFRMDDGSLIETGRIFTASDEDAIRHETETMTCNMADPIFAAVIGATPERVASVRVEIELPAFAVSVNAWSDGRRVVSLGNHTLSVFPWRFPEIAS